jgi:hypothetical protein
LFECMVEHPKTTAVPRRMTAATGHIRFIIPGPCLLFLLSPEIAINMPLCPRVGYLFQKQHLSSFLSFRTLLNTIQNGNLVATKR